MEIKSQASIRIQSLPEHVFDITTAIETLPMVFVGYGPIPAIVRAYMKDNSPMREGAVRIVRNSDGSEINELITKLVRPSIQEYQLVSGFKPPFSWLVKSANGRWDFHKDKDSTEIFWVFKFVPTSKMAKPLLYFLVTNFFRRAQENCLSRLRSLIEEQ